MKSLPYCWPRNQGPWETCTPSLSMEALACSGREWWNAERSWSRWSGGIPGGLVAHCQSITASLS